MFSPPHCNTSRSYLLNLLRISFSRMIHCIALQQRRIFSEVKRTNLAFISLRRNAASQCKLPTFWLLLVQRRLSRMSNVEYWKWSNVSANNVVVIFRVNIQCLGAFEAYRVNNRRRVRCDECDWIWLKTWHKIKHKRCFHLICNRTGFWNCWSGPH